MDGFVRTVESNGISASLKREGGCLSDLTVAIEGEKYPVLYHPRWEGISPNSLSDLPNTIRWMAGEWLCLPFGSAAPNSFSRKWAEPAVELPGLDREIHGFPANTLWEWEENEEEDLTLLLTDAPAFSLIKKTVVLSDREKGVEVRYTIHPEEEISLPIALHPTFSVPESPSLLNLEVGRFEFAITLPEILVDTPYALKPGVIFDDLKKAPLRNGAFLDATSYSPADSCENLIQLCGIAEGKALLHYPDFTVILEWDEKIFPSLILWISNRGRPEAPWNGENVCLGIEPVASAFGYGEGVSLGSNPISQRGISTYHTFKKSCPLETAYRVTVIKQ